MIVSRSQSDPGCSLLGYRLWMLRLEPESGRDTSQQCPENHWLLGCNINIKHLYSQHTAPPQLFCPCLRCLVPKRSESLRFGYAKKSRYIPRPKLPLLLLHCHLVFMMGWVEQSGANTPRAAWRVSGSDSPRSHGPRGLCRLWGSSRPAAFDQGANDWILRWLLCVRHDIYVIWLSTVVLLALEFQVCLFPWPIFCTNAYEIRWSMLEWLPGETVYLNLLRKERDRHNM